MTLEDTTVVAVALAEVSWATVAGIVPVVVPVEELKKKNDNNCTIIFEALYSHTLYWQKIRETKRFTKLKNLLLY